MAIIPDFFLNAVVALGIDHPTVANEKLWIGTGFIVGRKETDDPTLSTHYIITNKHVIGSQRYIYVRFNSLGDSLVKDYRVGLYNMDGTPCYSPHPNLDTDVIALQILPKTLINDKSIWGSFDLTEHALTLAEMQKTGVQEGSLIYSLGFPMELVDVIKAPICRLGCISRIADAFIRRNENPVFLVDAQVFPGNSGGPIVSRPESIAITGTVSNSSANLIGILSSYIPYREVLYSRQTGQSRMIQEENSGLTVVHPVDRIKEVVELEWLRAGGKTEPASSNEQTPEDTNEEVTV